MQFFLTTANLSYDQKCCPFGDLTNVSHDLQLLRLRHVHHSQAGHFWYSTAKLSYKPLWYLSEVHTSLQACCTTKHPMYPQHFWWQWCIFTTPTDVSISLWCFWFSIQFRYDAYNSNMGILCPASWLPGIILPLHGFNYLHPSSTWLHMQASLHSTPNDYA